MAPLTSDMAICICVCLVVMACWAAFVVDVNGAFLKGIFRNREKIYLDVPKGSEKYYPGDVVLLVKQTIYGLF